ncbi:uncharacterized protein LOC124708415 isoform X1 [Lolium rigidum]|uniref:uncharacterized protein LOC124708415 isoform X1 n=1 Tax=Lolium rigidum TaxID=89674 RepID=UPI001F5CC52C|nr:uncharacterized protein LOC124708415 isoform X1 [Lolium rigidum]XP_047096048.1 uncharacterized protein LOC124708415 isoform X1 [Lolium rigidum]
MASQPSRRPPADYPNPPDPTTIAALDGDLLREILLRLPDLPSLAFAAFTCRTFLDAIRSSPAFRRRFRGLHASPLLALFLTPHMRAIPAFTTAWRPSDLDLDAATDFFRTILRDDDDASFWGVNLSGSSIPYLNGYVALENRGTKQRACYNPQTKALDLCPNSPRHITRGTILEFYTLSAEEGQRPSRVVCVRHDHSWSSVRLAVFSSNTMEWQIFPEAATLLPEGDKRTTRTVMDGFVCWEHDREGCIFVLNTATLQLSRMDLPPHFKGVYSAGYSGFKVGQTKDGKLCIVSVEEHTLLTWVWAADQDGVERFVLGKMFLLLTVFKNIMECSAQDKTKVRIMAVMDGFVYLSICHWKDFSDLFKSSEWFLSFSLETGELCEMFKSERQIPCPIIPYIMEWPPSLVHNMQNSESKVAGGSGEDGGPVGTEEATPILARALQSFKGALINDDELKVSETDAFLLCIDAADEENSLVRKMITLDAVLTAVRDRVLSISADPDVSRKRTERESWFQMCKGKLWRAFFAS